MILLNGIMISFQADVTKRDNLGMQPIHHAAQAGQTAAVMFLITQYTIPVNAVTHTTLITPLHVAAKVFCKPKVHSLSTELISIVFLIFKNTLMLLHFFH